MPLTARIGQTSLITAGPASVLTTVALLAAAGAMPSLVPAAVLGAGCEGAVLSASFTRVEGSSAMGRARFSLRLTNESSQTCSVPGLPSLRLLDEGGRPLPTGATASQSGRGRAAIVLGPGTSASATALVAVDVPGPGDVKRSGAPCEPRAVHLRVSAAAGTSLLATIEPPTSVCRRGSISLRPFVVQRPVNTNSTGLVAMIQNLLGYPPNEYTLTLRYDSRDPGWVLWSYRPRGPGDPVQGGIAFAHRVAGHWLEVAGPGDRHYCLPGVPTTVLRAFAVACVEP